MSKPTVVIVGANGAIGSYVLKAFLSPEFKNSYTLPIRVVTRDAAKAAAAATSGESDLKFYTADIASGDGLDTAFKGVDVVVNLLGTSVTHGPVADAAKAANAKLYIPSEFGSDVEQNDASAYANLFSIKAHWLEYARGLGLKVLPIFTGVFTEWLLTIPPIGGINFPAEGQLQYFGDAGTLCTTTSLVDVGKTVAAVASKDPATLPDKIHVSGGVVSAASLRETYKKVTGKDLEMVGEPLETATGPALAVIAAGIKSQQDFVVGLKGYFASGKARFEGKQNEFVSKGFFEFQTVDRVAAQVYA